MSQSIGVVSAFGRLRPAAIAVVVMLSLSACGGSSEQQQQQQKAGAQKAPTVSVMTVHRTTVRVGTDLPGRLESFRTAEVRAQVGGIIKRRLFQEGSYVRAGQPLYQLDNATYVASLESARAQLASAQAALAKANADLARYRPLVAADAISKQDYDAAVAAKHSAEANVSAARAAIRSANISVGYARITAPISGHIGRSQVSEGTLLTAGGSTVLATIQQTNPMYVNVSQSASSVMQLRREIAEGKMQAVNGGVDVTIVLEDGSEYPQKGRLLFADPTVDKTTGQVSLRVEVPNEDNILLPGLYVRVRLPQGEYANAIELPQSAVSRGAENTVTIVNPDGTLGQKAVTIAGQNGNNWIITDGLADGDKVVLDGTMSLALTGQTKVTPQEVSAASAPAASSAPVASATAASATDAQAASTASAAQ